MKKFISILLMVILATSISVSVCAESNAERAVAELGKYGIMAGEGDENIRLSEKVTRAEMAKMIVLMTGLATDGVTSYFTDVPEDHWAYEYIAQAASKEIINGMGDGTFSPDQFITYGQAIKMVVCALGYGKIAIRQGHYPHGYVMVASDLGITPHKADMSDFANRGDIAIMLAAALDVPIVVLIENEDSVNYKVLDGKNGESLVTLRTNLER